MPKSGFTVAMLPRFSAPFPAADFATDDAAVGLKFSP
jgi:hypothetical protein